MLKTLIILFFYISSIIYADPYAPLDIDFLRKKPTQPTKPKIVTKSDNTQKNKSTLPDYEEFIKDLELIEGLFSFYWDKEKNKLFLSLNPNQLETIYLANLTRKSGDATFYDSGTMLWDFPFKFAKLVDKIQLIHVNTSYRADESSAIHKSIKNNFTNSIVSIGTIVSAPHPNTQAILVNANELFVKDLTYVSERKRGMYKFDKNNSYVSDLQSYPHNSEIQILSHFVSNKRNGTPTIPNSHSMMHTYHISLSELQLNGEFFPRVADDRIGYFSTIYQDYTSTLKETPYVRYINRWNLKKKYPNQALSEPENPIIFWLENTIPQEFRAAVTEGILAWNQAFEKIGFKNAIVAKQMPDDATWHPGDVRYNTIRWIVQPGSGYAVGPSRANPFTGEIYDADIRISADFTRAFYREFDEFVIPVTSDGPIALWEKEDKKEINSHQCQYADNLRDQMILSWHSLINEGHIRNSSKELQEYVHKGLVDLVLHEVGHTLGLRHNFKASSIFTIDELSDSNFTNEEGISGSVMDYHPVSLLDKGNVMFQTKPGPYDEWAIAYGYSIAPYGNENALLKSITSQSNVPHHVYGTDEDAFGLSSRGIDPLCSTWDLGNDPIMYYNRQLDLVDKLWNDILENFLKDGNRFQKIRSVFSQGIGEYYRSGKTAAKFIGGIYFSRNHIGDPDQKNPFIVVEPYKQREALEFINSRIFHKDAFSFNEELLNKLSPERYDDFMNYVWRLDRIDYPLHYVINRIQANALFSIFHPRRISRIQDNELRYQQEDKFTMAELFNSINNMLWTELKANEDINSFRRELQNSHLTLLRVILLDLYDYMGFPNDAKILARANLKTTLKNIYNSLSNQNLNQYTKAHLENAAEEIESLLEARINFN